MVNMRIVSYFLWLFCQASWPGNMVNVWMASYFIWLFYQASWPGNMVNVWMASYFIWLFYQASSPRNMVNVPIFSYFIWLFYQASWPGNMVSIQIFLYFIWLFYYFIFSYFIWLFYYFIWLFYQYLRRRKKEYSFASNLAASGHSLNGLLFTNEEQNKVGSRHIWYFCHTCQPCLWHHWHRLLGTKWQHSLSYFSLTDQAKNNSNSYVCVFYSILTHLCIFYSILTHLCIFYSILTHGACGTSLAWFPFNFMQIITLGVKLNN